MKTIFFLYASIFLTSTLEAIKTKEFNRKRPLFTTGSSLKMTLHSARDAHDVDILITSKAGVEARDDKRNCPLHYAPNAEVTRALIDAGAPTNLVNLDGKTPFEIHVDNKKILLVLLQHNARITFNRNVRNRYDEIVKKTVGDDFLAACFIGDGDCVDLALKNSRTPRELANRVTLGMTPLMAAISQGHLNVVALLLDSVEITNKHIKLAQNYRYHKIALLLIRAVRKRKSSLMKSASLMPPEQARAQSRFVGRSQGHAPTVIELGHVQIKLTRSLHSTSQECLSEQKEKTEQVKSEWVGIRPIPHDKIIQPATLAPHPLSLPTTSKTLAGRRLIIDLLYDEIVRETQVRQLINSIGIG